MPAALQAPAAAAARAARAQGLREVATGRFDGARQRRSSQLRDRWRRGLAPSCSKAGGSGLRPRPAATAADQRNFVDDCEAARRPRSTTNDACDVHDDRPAPTTTLETRDPRAREAALMARAAAPGRARHRRTRPPSPSCWRASTPRASTSARGAGRAAGDAQAASCSQRQQRAARTGDPFGGFAAHRLGRRCRAPAARAVFQSPGPIYEPEGEARRLLAHGARAVRRRLSRRRPGAQQLQLPPDAGRLDDGSRRACARLHGLPRRRRQYRTAAAGDRRTAAARLCRHAELPEDPARQGRRARRRRCRRCPRRWSAARPSRRRCATGSPSAASPPTSATPPPISG